MTALHDVVGETNATHSQLLFRTVWNIIAFNVIKCLFPYIRVKSKHLSLSIKIYSTESFLTRGPRNGFTTKMKGTRQFLLFLQPITTQRVLSISNCSAEVLRGLSSSSAVMACAYFPVKARQLANDWLPQTAGSNFSAMHLPKFHVSH